MDYKKLYEEALERAKTMIRIADDQQEAIGYASTIFPELQESEDERIRKEIISALKFANTSDGVYDKHIAWLEKQKKQVTDESDKIAAAYQLGRSDERKQKEQKECHSDEVLNRTYQEGFEDGFKAGRKVERQNSSDNDFIKPRMQEPWNNEKQKEPENTSASTMIPSCWAEEPSLQKEQKPHRVAVDTCEAIDKVREFDEQMEKEQKPADLSEMIVHKEPYIAPVPTPMVADEQKLTATINGEPIPTENYSVKIPLAEWSDTDNIGWDEAFACVTRAEKAAKNEEELQNAVTAEKWLKEIKFKYYVHPVKQEWSEEDEEVRETIIAAITAANMSTDCKKQVKDWLKSLKPQSQVECDTVKGIAWLPMRLRLEGFEPSDFFVILSYVFVESGVSSSPSQISEYPFKHFLIFLAPFC